MKITLSAIIALILLGCSSSQKSSENSVDEEVDIHASAPKTKSEPKSVESSNVKAPPVKADVGQLESAIQEGNDENINKIAQSILAKNPNDIQSLLALGVVHYKRGHLAGANMMFDKVLKIDPKNVSARNNRGLIMVSQREFRDAIKEFRKVLEVEPNNGIAAANIGSIYIEAKDYPKAFIALDIAYQKLYKDVKVINNYGVALTATGRHKEARDIFQKAMDKSPGNKDIMLNYAILLIDHLKQYQQGLDLIGKIKFLGLSPEVKNRINLLENSAKAGLK